LDLPAAPLAIKLQSEQLFPYSGAELQIDMELKEDVAGAAAGIFENKVQLPLRAKSGPILEKGSTLRTAGID
jgi:hypothetical protein